MSYNTIDYCGASINNKKKPFNLLYVLEVMKLILDCCFDEDGVCNFSVCMCFQIKISFVAFFSKKTIYYVGSL